MEFLVNFFLFYFKIIKRVNNSFCNVYERFLKTSFDYAYLRYYGVETELGFVKLIGLPLINKYPGSRIILKKGITLVSNIKGNSAGINQPVVLSTYTESAIIEIDEYSGASGATIAAVTQIRIGKFCGIGANVKIFDTNFHPSNPAARQNQKSINDAKSKPITIADSVWLNEGCLILKGVDIGFGSIIGPKSVVVKSVPALEFHAGNPAKFIFTVI